jgi:5-methylcytosine-specific restriction enzyme A
MIDPKETYCKYHKSLKTQQMNQQRTDKESKRYYRLAHWRKLRAQILREEPLCRECYRRGIITIATEVDHIDGNRYNLSRENLQPLCKSCHSRKTAKEQGNFVKSGR